MKELMPWMEGQRSLLSRTEVALTMGEGNPQRLDEAGEGEGWNIELLAQAAHSPDLNINVLCLFAS